MELNTERHITETIEKGLYMKYIAVESTFHTDIIEVPDHIAQSITKVQHKFDNWLYDKSNDHGCWSMIGGQKRAVSFDTSDFVNYINQYLLSDEACKAAIVQEHLSAPPDGMTSIFF